MEGKNIDNNNVVLSYQLHTLLFRDQHVIFVVLFAHGQMLLFLVVEVAFCCSEIIQRVECRLTSLD